MIENCTFTNFNMDYRGAGAVYFSEGGIVRNSTFDMINVKGNSGLYFTGEGTVESCSFNNCTSAYGGAAVSFNNKGTVKNSRFTNNKVDGSGGAIHFLNQGSIVENCIFINNCAGLYGGAIYCQNGPLTVDKSVFAKNCATYGGAIAVISGDFSLNNTVFSENEALSSINVDFDGKVEMTCNNITPRYFGPFDYFKYDYTLQYPDEILLGETFNVTATFDNKSLCDGIFFIAINGENYNTTINNGVANLTIANLTKGV